MNVEELPDSVWIGEAYNENGECVEQIVHLSEKDALEDITAMAEKYGVDDIRVHESRLWTGAIEDTDELPVMPNE